MPLPRLRKGLSVVQSPPPMLFRLWSDCDVDLAAGAPPQLTVLFLARGSAPCSFLEVVRSIRLTYVVSRVVAHLTASGVGLPPLSLVIGCCPLACGSAAPAAAETRRRM
ncbi:hypothetical protein ACUV84_005949 [Puccinellia chinampoensis]